jgi:hypothetical protein
MEGGGGGTCVRVCVMRVREHGFAKATRNPIGKGREAKGRAGLNE